MQIEEENESIFIPNPTVLSSASIFGFPSDPLTLHFTPHLPHTNTHAHTLNESLGTRSK